MNSYKRLNEETVILEGVYYTCNPSKKNDIKSTSGYIIDSIRINFVRYYPFKEEKK